MKDREEYISILEQDNAKLKKQIEERTKMYQNAYDYSQKMEGKAIILEIQQKEFIEWLKDKIQRQEIVIAENQEKSYFLIYENEKEDLKLSSQKAYIRRIILEEILQKYKEIIGDDK